MRACSTFAFVIAMSTSAPTAIFSAPCDSIITHGLRNISVAFSDDALTAKKYSKACSYDFSSLSDSQVANLEVEVFGYGSGSGGYDRSISEEQIKSWCNENRDVAQQNRRSLQQTETFYQGAVDAWRSCIALNARDVLISPRISPDGRTVDIAITYRGPESSRVILGGVPSNGFQCNVKNQQAEEVSFPVPLGTSAVNVHCERNGAEEREMNGQVYAYTPRGTISIQTSSDPFQLYFAEEYIPAAPDLEIAKLREVISQKELPVGTIIASVLTPDQFLDPRGPYETAKWAHADGSPLPAGSKYESITDSKTTPDLRAIAQSKVITGLISSNLSNGAQVTSIVPAELSTHRWTWFAGVRDIQGNRANNDFEQDVDHFQVFLEGDVVNARGRTLNWKHGVWGSWSSGTSNILGVSYVDNPVRYYIKIN